MKNGDQGLHRPELQRAQALDLVGKLLAAKKHPDDKVAHVMGTCAGYAYSDGQTVAMIMARCGDAWLHCLPAQRGESDLHDRSPLEGPGRCPANADA